MTERLELIKDSVSRTRVRMDEYTLELQRHGLEQVEREVRWLDGLIDHERSNRGARPGGDGRPAGTRSHAVEDDHIVAAQPPEKERG
jgi:hypothetical protein